MFYLVTSEVQGKIGVSLYSDELPKRNISHQIFPRIFKGTVSQDYGFLGSMESKNTFDIPAETMMYCLILKMKPPLFGLYLAFEEYRSDESEV